MNALHLSLSLEYLPPSVNRIYVAFSGGIDSSVLLHRLLECRQHYQIVLWHINHGLQANASSMERFSRSLADSYQIQSRIDRLDLDPQAGNLEANARKQRYALFAAALGNDDALFTAHHMDDQAETLLLNMMRGSGIAGLRAIALLKELGRGYLYRPLLNTTREQIEQYAQFHGLAWVEDPSNESLQFDRNFIRHEIMPLLTKRWPSAVSQMHRVCEWQNESHTLLSELAELDYSACHISRKFSDYDCLSIHALKKMSLERQKNLLRNWLKRHDKAVIGHKKMEQVLTNLESRPDSLPVVEADGFSIRQYQGGLYIVDKLPEVPAGSAYVFSDEGVLEIAFIGFRQSRRSILDHIGVDDEGQELRLQFRSDSGSALANSHRLKRLFQKHHVPPWVRPITPQIIIDGELAGLWLI